MAKSARKKTSTRKKKPARSTKRSGTAKRVGSKPKAKSSASPSRLRHTSEQVRDEAPIPTLALEDYTPQTARAEGVKDKSQGSTKFGWVGSGQCGGRFTKAFYDLGYRKVLALNTASQDLDDLDLPSSQKLLMDIGRKGAGKDMSRGRQAAIQYRQEIIHAVERIFSENVDHVMLVFGCGGGTGGGSAFPLIDTIRACAKHFGLSDANRRMGVLCTLPTAGEAASPKVASNAKNVMAYLTDLASDAEISPLIIIDNEKISRMYPGLTVKDFWPTINNTVSGLFDIFNRLSALSSPYTSFDSVDYQSILECGGCTVMGVTKVPKYTGRFDLSEAMKANLTKTLLADGFHLETAKVVGAIVAGGREIFASTPGLQDSINHAFDVLADLTGNATIHRGIFEDDKPSLRVYTMIGGLDSPAERLEQLREAA